MYYLREMEKWKKKANINLRILIFFPTIYLATLNVYTKFEDFGSHRSREICDGYFLLERKEKCTNKGNDKQEEANSLLQKTISYSQHLYKFQNPKFSSS